MKTKKYVWVIGGDIQSKKVFSYPVQIRLFAKENGFSVFDEIRTESDMIVFSQKDNWKERGFYAAKRELLQL